MAHQIHLWLELIITLLLSGLIAYALQIFIKRFPTHLFNQWKQDCEEFLKNPPQPQPKEPQIINQWLVYCGFMLTAALSWFFLGLNYQFLSTVLFISLVVPIAIIDWYYLFILDVLVYPLLWAGLLINLYGVFIPIPSAIFGAVLGYLIIAVPEKLYEWVRKKPGIGFGDAKLCAAIGTWVGVEHILILCFAAFWLALIGFILQKLKNNTTERQAKPLPFGPSLAFAGFVLLLVLS